MAAAEMALAGGLGFDLRLADAHRFDGGGRRDDNRLCESLGRLLVEVTPENTVISRPLLDLRPTMDGCGATIESGWPV